MRNRQFIAGLGMLVVTTIGCTGHGKFTSEALDAAKERQGKLKAAADYDMANTQFAAGNLDPALDSINQSLSRYDKVANAHLLKGRILLEKGQSSSAMDAFDAAAKIDPSDPEIDYFRGIVFERLGDYESALNCYKQALSRKANEPKYGLATAELLIDQKRLTEAKDLLESAQTDSSAQPGFRQALGHIALIEQKPDDALRYFEQAVSLEPSDPALREDLAVTQAELHKWVEAEANLAKVLLDPSYAQRRDLIYLRATCLIELRRPVDARALLLPLANDSDGGESVQAWLKLVDVGAMLEDDALLKLTSQRLISLVPNRPEGYIAIALVQRRAGEKDAALASANKALEKSPDDPAAKALKRLLEAR